MFCFLDWIISGKWVPPSCCAADGRGGRQGTCHDDTKEEGTDDGNGEHEDGAE